MTTTVPTLNRPARRASLRAAFTGLLVALGLFLSAVVAAPASAARSIAGPAGFSCGNRVISISPPRVWASHRTEQVVWSNDVHRWDAGRRVWVHYQRFLTYSTFNYFGQGLTSWSGGGFVNSRLHLRISHPGHYRVQTVVVGNQGGVTWGGLLAGGGYCYVS